MVNLFGCQWGKLIAADEVRQDMPCAESYKIEVITNDKKVLTGNVMVRPRDFIIINYDYGVISRRYFGILQLSDFSKKRIGSCMEIWW